MDSTRNAWLMKVRSVDKLDDGKPDSQVFLRLDLSPLFQAEPEPRIVKGKPRAWFFCDKTRPISSQECSTHYFLSALITNRKRCRVFSSVHFLSSRKISRVFCFVLDFGAD